MKETSMCGKVCISNCSHMFLKILTDFKKQCALIPKVQIFTNRTLHVRDNARNRLVIFARVATHAHRRVIMLECKKGHSFNHTSVMVVKGQDDTHCWCLAWLRERLDIVTCRR